MISTKQSADLCAEIYAQQAGAWDHYWQVDDVICAHRVIGDEDTLTFMGSKLLVDWMRDAGAAVPWWDEDIGLVPLGFSLGMEEVLARALGAMTRPVTIQGHSLGGARARIAAGKMIARGLQVQRLTVFGSPKAGGSNLGRIYDKVNLARSSWRNLDDPVPETPLTIPPLFAWQHTESYGAFSEHAPAGDLTPFRNHHCSLYVAGAARLEQGGAGAHLAAA